MHVYSSVFKYSTFFLLLQYNIFLTLLYITLFEQSRFNLANSNLELVFLTIASFVTDVYRLASILTDAS